MLNPHRDPLKQVPPRTRPRLSGEYVNLVLIAIPGTSPMWQSTAGVTVDAKEARSARLPEPKVKVCTPTGINLTGAVCD